nr:MAG TPA: hypothetical protein [Bacteriophage sp.]
MRNVNIDNYISLETQLFILELWPLLLKVEYES